MFYSRELLQKIKESVDLVAYAKQFTELRVCGENLWGGVCPHPDHIETDPSFRIWYDPKKKFYTWYCFGCNPETMKKKLDCFSFYIWIHDYSGSTNRKTLQEAVRFFAKEYDIPLEPDKYEDLYVKQHQLAASFHDNLFPNVKDYLYNRDLSDEDIEEYRIGFDGKRIVFPLLNKKKRCVGFCKRLFGNSDDPKYLNSYTSPIFKKKEYLYGIWKIDRSLDYVIITEGIFDVILALKYGFKNVLCTLGTAFCEEHLPLIKDKKVYLCFDGDNAGRKATERALKILNKHKVETRLLLLPDGQDLAEYCIENKERSVDLLQTSISSWEYYLLPIEEQYRAKYNKLIMDTVPQVKEILSNIPNESEKIVALNHAEKFLNIQRGLLLY